MKAKKYKLQEQFFTKKDFLHIMKNLPEEVRIMLLSDMREIITSFMMTMVLLTKHPLLGHKLEKIGNMHNFDIFEPPVTLTKTVNKSYLTDILGPYQSYITHILWTFRFLATPPPPWAKIKVHST